MVRANLPQSFQVDTSKAGVAPLHVKVQGPKGKCLHTWEQGVGEVVSSLRVGEGSWRPNSQLVEEPQVTAELGKNLEEEQTGLVY